MKQFHSLDEARDFVGHLVDVPIQTSNECIGPNMFLAKSSIDMGDDTFTNSYDLSFRNEYQGADVIAFDEPKSTHDFISNFRQYGAVASGGFFYLADYPKSSPRQSALNLSISDGNVRSLPVADRESVIANQNGLAVRSLAALGALTLNGYELEWSGSLTDYATETKVFSNGNVVIQHQMNEATGKARVLNEDSRYTPEITQDGIIDVGFIGKGRNHFAGITQNALGGTDIFAHDFVLRLPERYTTAYPELELHTIGELALSKFKGGAFSAGPLLNADFLNHPINQDLSLGSHPPFLDSRMARLVLYRTEDGFTHLRLFDGRPSSEVFPGVTPDEARTYVSTDGEVEWGCFLDPGQSARLSVNLGGQIQSYGNSHYVRWPTEDNPNYVWTPENGRPVANLIALY